jgi:addiction module HigA family antidote
MRYDDFFSKSQTMSISMYQASTPAFIRLHPNPPHPGEAIAPEVIVHRRSRNPPHLGETLKGYLGGLSVTEAASRLGVTRTTLSRILNGSAGISVDMALRLDAALGIQAETWLN